MPLIALPIVARGAGIHGWAALTTGQAIGAYASTVCTAGWTVLGAPMVAQCGEEAERLAIYARSFYMRLAVMCVLVAPVAVVTVLISPTGTGPQAVLFAISSMMTAMTVSWFAVGVSRPGIIGLYELLPRLAATLVSIPLVIMSKDVNWYGWGLIAAPAVGLALFHYSTTKRLMPDWPGWTAVRGELSAKRAAWAVEVTGSFYANAPVPVSTAMHAPPVAAAYASGDKLFRYALPAVTAVGNALQGWVLEVDDQRRIKRNKVGIAAMAALGLIGAAGLALMGAPFSAWFFGGAVATTPVTMLWLALAFFFVSSSTPLIRNVLMPARQERAVLGATVTGGLLGITTMVISSRFQAPGGVAIGLAASEFTTLVLCAVLAARAGLGAQHPNPR